MSEPADHYTLHYGTQSLKLNPEQADNLLLLLTTEVKDGKSVVWHFYDRQSHRRHVFLLGPNVPVHIDAPVETATAFEQHILRSQGLPKPFETLG
jgi:hypothetical protein